MHQARVEAAERTSVVVDLRDAEVARLELLNEALDPLFADDSAEVELFDRGLSRGDTPRLWIDAVAHVAMGRDKRVYRFLHDTRVGRRVLAKSHEIPDIVKAVTDYVARRLIERERALEEDPEFVGARSDGGRPRAKRRRRRRGVARWCSHLCSAWSRCLRRTRRWPADLDRCAGRGCAADQCSICRPTSRTLPSAARCRTIISQPNRPGSPSMRKRL